MNKNSIRRRKARERLYREQDGKCYYCDCEVIMPEPGFQISFPIPNLATLEHLIPQHKKSSKGLGVSNCVLACSRCNFQRGAKKLIRFLFLKNKLLITWRFQ